MKKMVKRVNPGIFILACLFLIFSFSIVRAQDPDVPQEIGMPQPGSPPRPNLLRELNLSPRQIQQIRRLNQERRPIMQESQRRLREANRALDEAIYADSSTDAEIQPLMKEVHLAQMEVLKNRTMTELAVRRILTPQQLLRFRDLRGQFMQKNNPENRMPPRQDKLRNLPRALRQKGFNNRKVPRPVQ